MNKTRLVNALEIIAAITGRTLSPHLIEFYLKSLEQFDEAKVLNLMAGFAKRGEFPTVAKIEEAFGVAEPTIDEKAEILSSEVIACWKRGYTTTDAKASMSAIAWEAVEEHGGWSRINKLTEDKIDFARKKIESICRRLLRTGLRASLKELPSPDDGSITSVLKSRTDRLNGLLNDGLTNEQRLDLAQSLREKYLQF